MSLPTNKVERKGFSCLVYFLKGALGLSACNETTVAPMPQEGFSIVSFYDVFKEN